MTGKDILVEKIKNTYSKRIAHYLSHHRDSKFSITGFGCDNCPIFNSKEECKEYRVWMMKTCEDILLEWLEEEQDDVET